MKAFLPLFLLSLSFFYVCAYDLTSSDIQTILSAHNNMRTKYGVPPLVWDSTIASGAKSYSDQCIWGHSGAANLGENIGYQGFSNPTSFPYTNVDITVNDWNTEEKDWTCQGNQCSGTCGHFTQNVWKTTTKVGCGLSACNFQGFQSQYLVCRYSPPGNYAGQHPLNAPKSTSVCPGVTPPPVNPPPVNPPPVNPPPVTPPPPVNPPPITPPPPSGSYSGCTVSCNGVSTTCSAAPQIMSNNVYCKCLSETYLWPVINAGTSQCNYWPPNTPRPLPYDRCQVNCNGQSTYCLGRPQTYGGSDLYCPCGDPGGFSWPVTNLNTPDCQYVSSAVNEASATTNASTLSDGQWIGICIGIVVIAAIIIVATIFVLKKRNASEVV